MQFPEHRDALLVQTHTTINYRISSDAADPRAHGVWLGVPHEVGRFRVLSELARGGMGIVLRAYDADLDREVAIKLMGSDECNPFSQEARVASQLRHPGIIPVYEAGTLPDGRAYFVMPLVAGENLASLLGKRRESSETHSHWLRIFEQICRSVAYAHRNGVVHRDLKPGNVMVGEDGSAIVMDWGVSTKVGSDSRQGCWIFGTPAYMPPEQAIGSDRVDPRCDVFGLGGILCEILTGMPPYIATDPVTVGKLAAAGNLSECHRRLADSRSPRSLINLARWCLNAEAGLRPEDGSEVLREISAIRRERRQRMRLSGRL
jgi:serine/threonine protein kinase